ncbi:hypothetical protein TNCV_2358501 [Trichonephila clavipes]|nr:hypothetical protein TNCV_2358501 [Trichonephila clavipes]
MRSLNSAHVSEPSSLSANSFPNGRALVPKKKFQSFPYISNDNAWLLDHLTLSLPVPTDDVVNRVFIESLCIGACEITSHSDMAEQWEDLFSSQVKPVEYISKNSCLVGSLECSRQREDEPLVTRTPNMVLGFLQTYPTHFVKVC